MKTAKNIFLTILVTLVVCLVMATFFTILQGMFPVWHDVFRVANIVCAAVFGLKLGSIYDWVKGR